MPGDEPGQHLAHTRVNRECCHGKVLANESARAPDWIMRAALQRQGQCQRQTLRQTEGWHRCAREPMQHAAPLQYGRAGCMQRDERAAAAEGKAAHLPYM